MKSCILPFVVGLGLATSAWAQSLVLIDTTFALPPVDGQLATQPAVESEGELPVKAPTKFSAIAPSAITPGTETLGSLQPPYALFKDDGRENAPEASGNLGMIWSLDKIPLQQGKYELTYEITPLTPQIQGARVQVVLFGDDNKPISVHIGEQPLYVAFSGDRMLANAGRDHASLEFSEGTTYKVQIRFDLDQNSWSASVNDAPLVQDLPFGAKFLEASATRRIGAVSIQQQAGFGDKPNAAWAISSVKLVRLP